MAIQDILSQIAPGEWAMIGLTVIIATAVSFQAIYTIRQARTAAAALNAERIRRSPKLKISWNQIAPSDRPPAIVFEVVNGGEVDVVVSGFRLEMTGGKLGRGKLYFIPSEAFGVVPRLPRRLIAGDSLRFLFPHEAVKDHLETQTHGNEWPAVRGVCFDSVGGEHRSERCDIREFPSVRIEPSETGSEL